MIKQFLQYAVPSALAMFISSLYTIIDGIFVGQGVGDYALAAVNLAMPFTIMIFGIATMFAVGGGALISKNLGAGNKDEAINIFRQCLKFLLFISILICFFATVFTNPISRILGAEGDLRELTITYIRYYGVFCIPNVIGIALNSFVRNDGRPKLAMFSTISGAVTNVILDYIFIFPLSIGIRGAAIATGLGQLVTVSLLLPHFLKRKGNLSFGKVKLEKNIIREFINIGIPSFFTEITFSIIILFSNIAIVRVIGDVGLSAFSIINYITTNIYMILLGLAFGAQPLISYYYGAKEINKVKEIYKITIISSLIINLVYSSICFIFGNSIISIFSSNNEIISLTYIGLNIFNLGFFIDGLNLTTTVYYQAIEKPKYSNIICALRSIICLPIVLIILSKTLGLNGVWISFIISELMTFILIMLCMNVKNKSSF